jgi:hypothetical protein
MTRWYPISIKSVSKEKSQWAIFVKNCSRIFQCTAKSHNHYLNPKKKHWKLQRPMGASFWSWANSSHKTPSSLSSCLFQLHCCWMVWDLGAGEGKMPTSNVSKGRTLRNLFTNSPANSVCPCQPASHYPFQIPVNLSHLLSLYPFTYQVVTIQFPLLQCFP